MVVQCLMLCFPACPMLPPHPTEKSPTIDWLSTSTCLTWIEMWLWWRWLYVCRLAGWRATKLEANYNEIITMAPASCCVSVFSRAGAVYLLCFWTSEKAFNRPTASKIIKSALWLRVYHNKSCLFERARVVAVGAKSSHCWSLKRWLGRAEYHTTFSKQAQLTCGYSTASLPVPH